MWTLAAAVARTGPARPLALTAFLLVVVWQRPGSDAAPVTQTSTPETASVTDVILVHALFRHGARTPVDTYPKDPYINATLDPVGWGQLTNIGKMQQYRQGQLLRQRYDELLGPRYSPSIIEARSTDKDRTKMSAQLELAGMWPPVGDQRWHPTLNWQPIPVHSVPVDEDYLLLGYQPCPRYYQLRDAVLASEEVQQQLQNLEAPELYENLTRITNLTIANPDDIQSLYSTLKAEEDFGLQLPEWTKEYYPHKMELITALSFKYNAYTQELQKIKGGSLLRKIMDDNRQKMNGTLQREFFMYAGHDSSIANLLMLLNVWDTQVPTYGILTLIELHHKKNSDSYSIQIYLRNSTDSVLHPLAIPGCGNDCPFTQFEELVKEKITFNWDDLCTVHDPNYVPPDGTPI